MSPGAKQLYHTGAALVLLGLISLTLALFSGSRLPGVCAWIIPGMLVIGALLMGVARPVVRPAVDSERRSRGLVIALSLFGLIALPYGTWNVLEGHSSLSWPCCNGVIVSSTVTRHGGRGGPRYSVDVSYRFVVAGSTYTASRIAFPEPSFSSPALARIVLNRYFAGATIPVFYSPENPESAVLEPGVSTDSWWISGIGAAVLVAAAIIIIVKRRRKVKIRPFWWAA